MCAWIIPTCSKLSLFWISSGMSWKNLRTAQVRNPKSHTKYSFGNPIGRRAIICALVFTTSRVWMVLPGKSGDSDSALSTLRGFKISKDLNTWMPTRELIMLALAIAVYRWSILCCRQSCFPPRTSSQHRKSDNLWNSAVIWAGSNPASQLAMEVLG